MKYSWPYGVFHWLVHYSLTVVLLIASGIAIFPISVPFEIFGYEIQISVGHIVALLITFLIDIDHISVFRKFGIGKLMFAQKRLISPLHNFFSLSLFAIISAFVSIFFSRELGLLFFVIVVHMLWDIFEDVFIFRTSFRRWERTWGLNKKDIEDAYNELLQGEPPVQEKKESRIGKAVSRFKDRV